MNEMTAAMVNSPAIPGTRILKEIPMAHHLFQDLSGQVFGLLTVVGFDHFDKWKNHYYKCQCTCGAVALKRDTELKSGKFFTCGSQVCRFWEKVDKNGPIQPHMDTCCWVWTGARKDGKYDYGVLKVPGQKRIVRAHVYSYELHIGPVVDLWVLHRCDFRPCVRPEHLFLGTHQDNMRDMAEKGRAGKLKKRMSQEEANCMVAEHASGKFTHQQLSEKYGVSLHTIRRWIKSRVDS